MSAPQELLANLLEYRYGTVNSWAAHILEGFKSAGYAVVKLPKPDSGDRKTGWKWDAGEDSVFFSHADADDRRRGIPVVMAESSAGEAQLVYTKSPRLLAGALLAAADTAEAAHVVD